jgi:hypothetical protein
MTLWMVALGTVLLLGIAGAAHAWPFGRTAAAVVLQHGPFEIVAEGRRISSGGFPNTSANPFETTEVTSFRVRHRGGELVLASGDERSSRFWRVLRLAGAPQPALLIASHGLHLVIERDGQLVQRPIGESNKDGVALQWLDAAPGRQPGPVQRLGLSKIDPGADTLLQGGRWLLLSSRHVLDLHTLAVHPVQPWILSGTDHPLSGLHGGDETARAFSPSGSAYVVPASGRLAGGGDYLGLLVIDIPSGKADALKLDRRRTRYGDITDINAEWVAHYFRWQRDDTGKERLLPQPAARPLPWRGRIVDFSSGILEYRVAPVAEDMVAAMRHFLVERHGAQVVPDWLDASRTTGNTLKVSGCGHVLALSHRDGHASLYAPAPRHGSTPVDCYAAIRRLGAAFDAELATGRHDALFRPD